eukprot:scaffold66139_cov69-Phaeocystis_antarctica.AAC.4
MSSTAWVHALAAWMHGAAARVYGVACWVCSRRGRALTDTAAACASKENSSRSGESEHSTTWPLARPSAAKPSHVPMA